MGVALVLPLAAVAPREPDAPVGDTVDRADALAADLGRVMPCELSTFSTTFVSSRGRGFFLTAA